VKEAKNKRTLFVKNLNFETTQEQLEELFKTVGKVRAANIVTQKGKSLSKGYGFVEMDTEELARKAMKKLQNHVFDKHALKLQLSKAPGEQDDD